MNSELGIERLEFSVIEHELLMPFAIAGGGMDSARAVITSVELSDGTRGIGESAPFPAVTGETVESTIAVLEGLWQRLRVLPPEERAHYIEGDELERDYYSAPAARCGAELALLDARLRAESRSMQDWMPPGRNQLESDITLPVGPIDDALGFVTDIVEKGFNRLKVKIGGRPLRADVDLLVSIHAAFPRLELILDANCAYDYETSVELLTSLEAAGVPVPLLEQPMAREAVAELARLQGTTDVLICLDESMKSVADLDAILQFPALRSVNFKTMKMGLRPTLIAMERAREHGMTCMIGGMVESRLSMTVSAALAMHYADTIAYVDLDTPLFMRPGPVKGGMSFDGPLISLPHGDLGHGCTVSRSWKPSSDLHGQ